MNTMLSSTAQLGCPIWRLAHPGLLSQVAKDPGDLLLLGYEVIGIYRYDDPLLLHHPL